MSAKPPSMQKKLWEDKRALGVLGTILIVILVLIVLGVIGISLNA